METLDIAKKDEIVMKLVHYFVTEENYTPIIVNGAKNEVWLENSQGPYNIIRINSNYIHNEEQLKFDIFKTQNVMKQIKSKTLSFKMKTLNIFLDVRHDVSLDKNSKNINFVKVNTIKGVKTNPKLLEYFPHLKDRLIDNRDKLNLIVNVTKDINEKTNRDNKIYEETFNKKPIIITYVLLAINIIMFLLTLFNISFSNRNLFDLLAINTDIVKYNQWYRLLTGTFLHADIMHLLFNGYALYIIGSQMEQFLGKKKFIIVYLLSAIVGSLFSTVITAGWSVGASGAIFGLLGSMLYFGYHYRLFLGNVLKTQIIPVIIINLAIGLFVPNIDIAAHFGGLIAGVLSTMAVGVKGRSTISERINGIICLIILIAFLIYLLFK